MLIVARNSRSARGIAMASRFLSLSRPSLTEAKRLACSPCSAARTARSNSAVSLVRNTRPSVGRSRRWGTPARDLLPFPIIIDQVPERDVIAALHQEQTAGTQGVAHHKGEGDFPDGPAEFAAGDQVGTPVRRYEAMRIIRRQHAAGSGIQGTQDLDGPE